MTSDPWSHRAELYRTSMEHSQGPDLDLVVKWASGCATAFDVATGGGHVARRLRDADLQVVSCDPAIGMQPDVVCYAEDLPFGDSSFDLTVSRVAAHHFTDVAEALFEMARVASKRVIIVDILNLGEAAEEAEKLRDPSHVRAYTEPEWLQLFADAGIEVDEVQRFEVPTRLGPWLDRTGCKGETAARVRELFADRTTGDQVTFERIALRGTPTAGKPASGDAA